ncbi:MAG TPA: GNAT family N-acetyltransferase [Cytophagaceae bacterium]|jgi:GNAT superfamily N-acetyltransferase|nr:GNAT family N-acetyltransferase [Cytophagaceae bacterium]
MVSIQSATREDIPALSELLTILFTQEADFTPDNEKQRSGLGKIIDQPETGHVLVLRESDTVIGMISLLYMVSTALGGRVAVLEDFILVPAQRGKGLGTSLLNAAIAFAKENSCLRITLLTDLDNDQAISFYLRNGFTKSAMTPMRLML